MSYGGRAQRGTFVTILFLLGQLNKILEGVVFILQVLATVRKHRDEQRAIVARKSRQAAALNPPPSKRAREETSDSEDEYAVLIDSDAPSPMDEVDRYLLMADPSVKAKDLLAWWKEKVNLVVAK